jgi:hypothetical protein
MSGLAVGLMPGFGTAQRTEGIPAWSSFDLRITKQIAWSGLDLTVYFDGRNLLNAEDLRRAFFGSPARRNLATEQLVWSNDSVAYAEEAMRSGAYNSGDIDMTFGGAGRGGCGGWVTASGTPNAANCAYLIAAETRFGDGDGVFTLAEQHAASMAYYRTAAGPAAFSGPPRAVRLGLQVGL